MCLHLRGKPHGQAADDEPLSHADKARGISPNKYTIYKIIHQCREKSSGAGLAHNNKKRVIDFYAVNRLLAD